MHLKLAVTNRLRDTMGGNHEHVFDHHGGTIGRAAHNDWVLPDTKRYISSVHASIEARDGGFYLVDTSMNGIYVNGEKTPLGPTQPCQLKDGMKLRMGNYHIAVSHVVSQLKDDQQTLMSGNFFEDKLEPETGKELSAELLVENDIAEKLDLESLLDDRMASANTSIVSTSEVRNQVRRASHTETVVATDLTQPYTATVHRLPGARSGGGDKTYQALIDGLGVDAAQLEARDPEQIAGMIGATLRMALEHFKVMKTARAQSKQALSMPTSQQDVDDLTPTDIGDDIIDLLLGRGQIHQHPADSLGAEMRALKLHNTAMHNAARAAIAEFIDKMAPQELAERFEQHGAGKGLFSASRKASLWDQFCRFYEVISQHDAEALPDFIKQEFARAYQASLQTLVRSGD